MANPQLENGYIRIATEIWQQLRQLKISPLERCILDYILEKTYGFNKKEDWISLSQFGEACDIGTSEVCRGLKKLKRKNIVCKENGKYIFNKNFDIWVLAKQPVAKQPVAKQPVAKQPIEVLAKQPDTIDNITINIVSKETTQSEQKKEYGNKEINKMLIALKTKIGITAFVDSSIERNMAKHCVGLLQKLGKDEFVRRLDGLLADGFHQKNCNKIKYVYNNIKGWIEPPPPKSNIAFIS